MTETVLTLLGIGQTEWPRPEDADCSDDGDRPHEDDDEHEDERDRADSQAPSADLAAIVGSLLGSADR